VTFAGYRFSERNYLTMGEYLDMRYREGYVGNSKELYTHPGDQEFRRPAPVDAHQLVASDLLEPPGDRSLQRFA
jgi:outer membrane usher protein FimD/PapC